MIKLFNTTMITLFFIYSPEINCIIRVCCKEVKIFFASPPCAQVKLLLLLEKREVIERDYRKDFDIFN